MSISRDWHTTPSSAKSQAKGKKKQSCIRVLVLRFNGECYLGGGWRALAAPIESLGDLVQLGLETNWQGQTQTIIMLPISFSDGLFSTKLTCSMQINLSIQISARNRALVPALTHCSALRCSPISAVPFPLGRAPNLAHLLLGLDIHY